MDFFRFSVDNVDKKQLDELMEAWNNNSYPYNFTYRISKEGDKEYCTLMVDDEEHLQKAVTNFPVTVSRGATLTNDMMTNFEMGEKIAKFPYYSRLNSFVCGYIRESYANEIGIENFQDNISQKALDYRRSHGNKFYESLPYKIVNKPVELKDAEVGISSKYYPIVFTFRPNELRHAITGRPYKRMYAEDYKLELRVRYNAFYDAVQKVITPHDWYNLYFTNVVGDMCRPRDLSTIIRQKNTKTTNERVLVKTKTIN